MRRPPSPYCGRWYEQGNGTRGKEGRKGEGRRRRWTGGGTYESADGEAGGDGGDGARPNVAGQAAARGEGGEDEGWGVVALRSELLRRVMAARGGREGGTGSEWVYHCDEDVEVWLEMVLSSSGFPNSAMLFASCYLCWL